MNPPKNITTAEDANNKKTTIFGALIGAAATDGQTRALGAVPEAGANSDAIRKEFAA